MFSISLQNLKIFILPCLFFLHYIILYVIPQDKRCYHGSGLNLCRTNSSNSFWLCQLLRLADWHSQQISNCNGSLQYFFLHFVIAVFSALRMWAMYFRYCECMISQRHRLHGVLHFFIVVHKAIVNFIFINRCFLRFHPPFTILRRHWNQHTSHVWDVTWHKLPISFFLCVGWH